MVLVIGGTGEAPSAVGLWTHVWPLACVRPDVNLADVGCGKRTATAHKGALEGTLTCIDRVTWMRVLLQPSYLECHGHLYLFTPPQYYTNETSDQTNCWHISSSKIGILIPFALLFVTEPRIPGTTSATQLLLSEVNFSSALLHPGYKKACPGQRLKQHFTSETLSMGSSCTAHLCVSGCVSVDPQRF